MISRFVFTCVIGSALTACAMFQGSKQNNHDAICKELNRQIIWSGASGTPKLWSGATGNPVQGTQQRAENETLMRSYREEGCIDRRIIDGSTE